MAVSDFFLFSLFLLLFKVLYHVIYNSWIVFPCPFLFPFDVRYGTHYFTRPICKSFIKNLFAWIHRLWGFCKRMMSNRLITRFCRWTLSGMVFRLIWVSDSIVIILFLNDLGRDWLKQLLERIRVYRLPCAFKAINFYSRCFIIHVVLLDFLLFWLCLSRLRFLFQFYLIGLGLWQSCKFRVFGWFKITHTNILNHPSISGWEGFFYC